MITEISVVIPAYNEEETLQRLFDSLYPVMNEMKRSFEIIFVNDGSSDRTLEILQSLHAKHSEVKIVDLNGNFGQHMAIMAGFNHVKGKKIITLDADLQNPPSEIPKIVEEMDKGHDVVGSYRINRQDPLFRKIVSKMANKLTNKIARLNIKDYGCMLRGYDKKIVDIINKSQESTTFIPALGQKFAANPIEIPVSHKERETGVSKYGIFQLIRLNFDLVTSFSIFPLQMVTVVGMTISILSLLLVCYLFLRRLIIGPEAEGLFTLMAIQFFLIGITLFSLGIVGEYMGRIYREVSRRPRYTIRKIFDHNNDSKA